jgi:hypothetical protein
MWRLPRTSGYSYPRVVMIRIDVHHAGENMINMTHTLPMSVHVCPAYTYCGQSPYVVTFHESSTDLNRPHCSREKGLPTQSITHRLTDPRVRTQFLSQTNQWSSRLKLSLCRWQATRLTRHISPACNRYVQNLHAGPTHQSLTVTGGATALKASAFHIPLLGLLNQRSSSFHLRPPPDLQFNQVLSIKLEFEFKGTYGCHVVFRPLGHLPWPTTMPSHS